MGDEVAAPRRGRSHTTMRVAVCKDCQREIEALERAIAKVDPKEAKKLSRQLEGRSASFTYPENEAVRKLDRGGSRSDRCPEHRRKHGRHTEGMAVAYVDLATVGEVRDRKNPTGPLGGLGPLPDVHDESPASADLAAYEFGMDDQDIIEILELLRDRQVLVLKAGTGTGKSTFAPYRLMNPPTEEDCRALGIEVPPRGVYQLSKAGPIIVTEPRVAAATGVATYVGTKLSGTGVGAGYPVGYQVSGDRNHDDACQLVFVTDGTMINWLREGRLSRIGTVIVDEAHERNTNIDFIMGYLRRDLSKYPHLRVIITSATFNTDFYVEYFGGPEVVAVKDVPAVKTVGYGMPLFPGLDTPTEREEEFFRGAGWAADLWPVIEEPALDERRFIDDHWPTRLAPPLKEHEVTDLRPVAEGGDLGYEEDLHKTTAKLLPLRFEGYVPVEDWKAEMPDVLAEFVIDLAKGLDEHEIFGDILGFLPTGTTIGHACEKIRTAIGDRADVFGLLSTLPDKEKDDALSARRKGDKRKIVISTNLAETSLTVEGVRFVVDSGLIAQSEWNPELAVGGIPTKPHSQAGIKQRWGRVGRKAPGWVFPLYTKEQFAKLDEDTPPGSARENLEALIMTARLGGIDDVKAFPWPAAFDPTTTTLDAAGTATRETFLRELDRADVALRGGGAVDGDGHPTAFGREMSRLSGFGSTASTLAILYADRLACVPEVATIMALLEDERLIGQKALLVDDFDWPVEWRLEAARRHRGLASLAEDDAHLVLLICAAWERADRDTPPWQDSGRRREWARRWWVDNDVLVAAAKRRQEALAALSPAMKEEVKRFVEPALLDRARRVIGRTMGAMTYRRNAEGLYVPASAPPDDAPVHEVERDVLTGREHPLVIALRRRDKDGERFISSLVAVPTIASEQDGATGVRDAMRLVREFRATAPADPRRNAALSLMAAHPVGSRMRVKVDETDRHLVAAVLEDLEPSERPPTQAEREQEGVSRRAKRRRRRFDPDDTEGTASDVGGEIQRVVRRGVDDDSEEQTRFTQADRRDGDAIPCGTCVYCRSGREAQCREKTFVAGRGKPVDALADWNRRSRTAADVTDREIRGNGELDAETWYEVAGYVIGDDRPGVAIVPRSASSDSDAEDLGEHGELVAGQKVEVEVGEPDATHSAAVRVFYRVDGGGRCVIAEAGKAAQDRHGAIGMSLDRFAFGLLESLQQGTVLTATAVPAGANGQMTITLLEALHAHLKAAEGTTAMPMLPPLKGRGAHEPWAIGRVVTARDERGRARVELALTDSAAGIKHFFELRGRGPSGAGEQEPPSADGGEPQSDAVGIADGDAVRIQFAQNVVPLPVGGVAVEGLAEILRQADRQLRFRGSAETQSSLHDLARRRPPRTGDRNGDGEGQPADEDEGEVVTARPDDQLVASGAPVHKSIAQLLADLDPDPAWQRDVWAFWARSHHLRPTEWAPTDAFEPLHLSISRVRLSDQTPLEQRRRRFEAFVAAHAVGDRVEGEVKTIDGRDVYVSVGDGVDIKVPTGELRWGDRADNPADHVAIGDALAVKLTAISAENLRLSGSARALLPDPALAILAAARPGSMVTGVVKALPDSGNAWVELVPGFDVQLSKREIAWDPAVTAGDALTVGESVKLMVLSVDADQRTMKLSLRETLEHPHAAFVRRHPPGTTVTGSVAEIVGSGGLAMIDLGGGVRARLPRSEASHERLESLDQVLAVGEVLEAKLTAWDAESRRITLSAKALQPSAWEQLVSSNPQGATMVGQVQKIIPKSVFVDLGRGIRGKIFIKYLSSRYVDHPSEVVQEGQWLSVRVLGVDAERRLVDLAYAGPATKPPATKPNRISRPADTAASSPRKAPAPVVPARSTLGVRAIPVPPTPPPSTSSRPREAPRPLPHPQRVPRSASARADTVEKAADKAARSLGLTVRDVTVRVLDEPKRGLLGRTKRQAYVEVTERL